MWVVAGTGDTPWCGQGAADPLPLGCAGSRCRPGLPSCCQAGTGTVSSERFPSRGLGIMHLEQHSLIQVCDLSENQIPVISLAIWPPRTQPPAPAPPGRQLRGSGCGVLPPCAPSLSCCGEGREGCGAARGGVRHAERRMPQGRLFGMVRDARGRGQDQPLTGMLQRPCAHTAVDAGCGQDPDCAAPPRDALMSLWPHTAVRARMQAGLRVLSRQPGYSDVPSSPHTHGCWEGGVWGGGGGQGARKGPDDDDDDDRTGGAPRKLSLSQGCSNVPVSPRIHGCRQFSPLPGCSDDPLSPHSHGCQDARRILTVHPLHGDAAMSLCPHTSAGAGVRVSPWQAGPWRGRGQNDGKKAGTHCQQGCPRRQQERQQAAGSILFPDRETTGSRTARRGWGPQLSPPLIPSSLRLSHYSDICARHVPGRSNLLRRN